MSSKPKYLDDLIDQASKAAGNDAQLAKRLKVGRSSVADWRQERKPCPPADVALMAHIAGLDAESWGARALIAQHEGSAKGELLKVALKKALNVTSDDNPSYITSMQLKDTAREWLLSSKVP